ncbi:MAG TPA: membrane dipeptidase [Tepidisphaeraceae bacterium]|jgi:membrane dipeptidase
MFIFDAHLDLAYNALRGRDVLRPAREQTPDSEGIPSVGLPDLRAGGVGLICATIFCAPTSPKEPGYRTPEEAHAMGLDQLRWYRQQADAGQFSLIGRRDQLPSGTGLRRAQSSRVSPVQSAPTRQGGAGPINAILLLEGADPLRSPADVKAFVDAGVRIVGLAWKRTRYAGGTGAPGPLTSEGAELVRELDRFGIIHDASHLAEESFWQLLDLTGGRTIASHSNCRSIIPTDRQLTDAMIRAIAQRDGVIGINFYDRFLIPPAEYAHRRATLQDVVAHMKHMCDLIGDAAHVAIGTDMDGGLGREQIPKEIETSADLPRVADALAAAGFSDPDVLGIIGGNWLRFFTSALPE